MKFIIHIAKKWLPPVLLGYLKTHFSRSFRFEGRFTNWVDAQQRCSGYNASEILTRVLEATKKVKSGEARFERDSLLFCETDYFCPTTTAILLSAAQNAGVLRVLDIGGALGSVYFKNKDLLAGLKEIKWAVVEQRNFVDCGKTNMATDQLEFHISVADSLKSFSPNLVILSSVLQYLNDWESTWDEIQKSKASLVVVDRTPFHSGLDDIICIQRVSEYIYPAEYPMKIVSEPRFLESISGWEVMSKFESPEGVRITSEGDKFKFSGYLVRKNVNPE
jgi:putative methyltransferase (TIGR04325 family)